MADEYHQILFHEFMTHLKRQGFILGVEHYLRLQALLNHLGTDLAPEDFKYVLGPIFATSKKQQRLFYRIFDMFFGESAELLVQERRTRFRRVSTIPNLGQSRPSNRTTDKDSSDGPSVSRSTISSRPTVQEILSDEETPEPLFAKKWPYIVIGVIILIIIIAVGVSSASAQELPVMEAMFPSITEMFSPRGLTTAVERSTSLLASIMEMV